MRELVRGIPNEVEGGSVFVMNTKEGAVRLKVRDSEGERPSADYGAGDTITDGGTKWTVVEIVQAPDVEHRGPPGTGSGDVVALIARVEPG